MSYLHKLLLTTSYLRGVQYLHVCCMYVCIKHHHCSVGQEPFETALSTAIDTNNGTEALNKALKYTYLPKGRRSTNLSGIVTILIETFLPALRQKYLFANFEQYESQVQRLHS